MTPPTDLPHRFVACKNWAWTDGMRGTFDIGAMFSVVMDVSGKCLQVQYRIGKARAWTRSEWRDAFPVLNPATLGCVLARIRRLRNDPTICPYFDPLNGWALKSCKTGERITDWHDTEEAAYLDGLENS